jgi:hypothetical protein
MLPELLTLDRPVWVLVRVEVNMRRLIAAILGEVGRLKVLKIFTWFKTFILPTPSVILLSFFLKIFISLLRLL